MTDELPVGPIKKAEEPDEDPPAEDFPEVPLDTFDVDEVPPFDHASGEDSEVREPHGEAPVERVCRHGVPLDVVCADCETENPEGA